MEGLSSQRKHNRRWLRSLLSRGTDQLSSYGWITIVLPLLALLVVAVLWLVSLPLVQLDAMSDIGLLSVLPIQYYIALGVLAVSISMLILFRPDRTGLLLLHNAAFIMMVHGTPAILYGTLRYSWAWKHVGIVDYILRHGSVTPTIPLMNAYHNWPGFFSLNALITSTAGLQTALGYARWAPVFFNLVFLGGLYLVYNGLTADKRLVWSAIWFFFISSWVGQDYFSPQAFAFFFYLLIIGIMLRWFQVLPQAGAEPVQARGSGVVSRFFSAYNAHAASDANVIPSTPGMRAGMAVIAILLMAVLVFTHQLTPMIAIVSLLLLVVFNRIYTRGMPILLAVMTFSWVWFIAYFFVGDNLRSLIFSVGTLESNVAQGFINLSAASAGQATVAVMGRALTMGVILLAVVGFISRRRNGHADAAALLLTIAPFPMIAASSYGGEILFRVFFFSLPFLAFFLAAMFYPDLRVRRSVGTAVLAAVLSIAMLAAFLFAYYGKEKQYYFSRNEVAASEALFTSAPVGSLIIEGTRNYPSLYKNYEDYLYVAISREPRESQQRLLSQPVETMMRWMGDDKYPATYLIITRSMKAEVDMIGELPAGSLDRLEQALINSPSFKVVYSNPDATIFQFNEEAPAP